MEWGTSLHKINKMSEKGEIEAFLFYYLLFEKKKYCVLTSVFKMYCVTA